MIRWLGTKKIKLATIVLPGGFAKRKKEQHVRDLAASIERGGVISLPVVQDKPRKLVAGGDRLAALMLNKVTAHEVRIVRGTAQELEELMLEENLLRRRGDDYAAMTKRLVELRTGDIEAADRAEVVAEAHEAEADVPWNVLTGLPVGETANEEPAPVGRPKTAKGKAREQIAKETGRTPEAIRQAEKRAAAKEREAAEPEAPPAPVSTVETYGLPLVTNDEAVHLRMVRDALAKVDSLLRRAQASLVDEVEGNTIGGVISSPIRAALHQLAADVRAAIPVAACPYCKRLEARTANCGACKRTGFVGAETMLGLADELRLGGENAMVSGPRGLMPYAGGTAKAKPPTGHRKLRIETADGQPFPTE